MRIYLNNNVFDESLERIRWLFDEFDNVVVSTSGGKDSAVILNLSLIVAEEKNRLPLKVMFLDQEAEWQATIDYMRIIMKDDRVEPVWIQSPFKIFNTTSIKEPWLYCWEEGGQWLREKEDISIHDNNFNTDRFAKMFPAIMEWLFPDQSACFIAGVRAEESHRRLAGMTLEATYKHATWGKVLNKNPKQYTFYPIYDWQTSDVWKAIDDNNWVYNKIYNKMYQYGIAVKDMRVSNLHHETAVHNLFFLHELEPDTWQKLSSRIAGIHTTKHMKKSEMMAVKELPVMFESWKEYRDYLTDKLIEIEENRLKFHRKWARMDLVYDQLADETVVYKNQIASILHNDWEFERLRSFENRPPIIAYRKWKRGDLWIDNIDDPSLVYIKPDLLELSINGRA
jgi:predicted phosphoadenosine phosphosulfate sulfurtransferase